MIELLKRIPGVRQIGRTLLHSYRQHLAERQARVDLAETRKALKHATQKRIVIGASGLYDPGWIPTEIGVLNVLKKSDWNECFARNSIDALLAEHVWEHLTLDEGRLAAQHCYSYLRPGGNLRVAVPDGNHPDPEYIENVRVGGTGPGAHDHKVLYTYRAFEGLFEEAGFEVTLLEYFDEQGTFHYTNWDTTNGTILRSHKLDERNTDGVLNYTSLILDARKPRT
ncbi:MAG: hypothetical protein ACFCD0_04130 [Gemmataceae bacterium]